MTVSYEVPVFNGLGQVTDKFHRPLATVEELDQAVSDTSGDYERLPIGSTITITKSGGTWPGSPTGREDLVIIWKGAEPSPPIVSTRTVGVAGLLDNVDLRLIV
jgi:hypothetical protein